MNIIEKLTEILLNFPKISIVCNKINVDFADVIPSSYGLLSNGDNLLFEDILGNQTRKQSFLLYSTFSGINDYERMQNSSVLTELSVWLSENAGEEFEMQVKDEIHNCYITKITAGDGKLYEVLENSTNFLRYQLQIEITYKIEF